MHVYIYIYGRVYILYIYMYVRTHLKIHNIYCVSFVYVYIRIKYSKLFLSSTVYLVIYPDYTIIILPWNMGVYIWASLGFNFLAFLYKPTYIVPLFYIVSNSTISHIHIIHIDINESSIWMWKTLEWLTLWSETEEVAFFFVARTEKDSTRWATSISMRCKNK